jgi:hypothetical protein
MTFVSWLRFLVVALPENPLWVSEITSIKLTRPKKLQSYEIVLPKSGKLRSRLLKLTNVLLLG